jgi:hypothetical protein
MQSGQDHNQWFERVAAGEKQQEWQQIHSTSNQKMVTWKSEKKTFLSPSRELLEQITTKNKGET